MPSYDELQYPEALSNSEPHPRSFTSPRGPKELLPWLGQVSQGNMGALILIRIGFWGLLYAISRKKSPQNPILIVKVPIYLGPLLGIEARTLRPSAVMSKPQTVYEILDPNPKPSMNL